MGELGQRSRELDQENAQHRATIAGVKQNVFIDERHRDHQLLMAQPSRIAGLSDLDPEFRDVYEACRAYTMTSTERFYALYTAIEYTVRVRIPGARSSRPTSGWEEA